MSGGPKVTVAQGELLGKTVTTPSGKTYFSFQGIPYAKPPIGSLRFKAPEYPESWTGLRDATSPGSKCAQIDPYRPKKFEGSEDCLFLNVHTPKLPDRTSKLAVIVFIHGGRYLVGHGASYQPDYLIEKDVVVVTINYRLSILGFLHLDIPEVPGNAGLKDAVFALRWVQVNIAKFNGDPKNVTVFGESAGAATTSSLLTSPMCEGLFQKVILESGSFVNDIFLMKEDSVSKAKNIAEILGNNITDPKELLMFLQTVPVEKLIEITSYIMRKKIDPRAYFSPVIENKFSGIENFFIEDPIICLKEGRYRKFPMIVGYNSLEGLLFLTIDKNGSIIYEKNITSFIPRSFYADKKSALARRFAEEVKEFYFGERTIGDNTKQEYIDLVSDVFFIRDTYRFLEYTVGHQENNLWLYRFSYMGSLHKPFVKSLGMKGATHSDQLSYKFYSAQKKDLITEDDKRVIKFFSDAWTNFAKFSNPTIKGSIEWLPANRNHQYCLDIDSEVKLLKHPEEQRMEFWKHIYRKYGNERAKL